MRNYKMLDIRMSREFEPELEPSKYLRHNTSAQILGLYKKEYAHPTEDYATHQITQFLPLNTQLKTSFLKGISSILTEIASD
jgi:hypothetical protein